MDNLLANNEVMTTLINVKGINIMMAASEKEIKLVKDAAVKAAVSTKNVAADTKSDVSAAKAGDGSVENQVETEASDSDVSSTEDDATTSDAAVDTAEGEAIADEVIADEGIGKDVIIDGGYIDGGINMDPAMEGMYTDSGMIVDPGMPQPKDPILSSWPFVIGISSAVLIISILLGVLLAKRKIKKGIELYED